jgi:transcription elongation factor Elf1
MKQLHRLCFFLVVLSLISCFKKSQQKKTVLVIPVYGQSLALGEEAIRITDFDSLNKQTHHRVLTENLDDKFGYLSDTHFRQWMKKLLQDRRRAFELSIYGMSEAVVSYLDKSGKDSVLICTFPGGRGATSIVDLGKGSEAYNKFLDEIENAYKKARSRGWNFVVPALCWMQGEDDIVWKKSTNYKRDLKQFQVDLNKDIKAITKQKRNVVCIAYQTNCLTLSKEFNANNFNAKETSVPQAQLELVRDDSLFMASGPTYPYSFAGGERVHLDGISQKRLGYLAGLSVIRLLESQRSGKGLTPSKITVSGNVAEIAFNVPNPPLVLDTTAVLKAANYGFSVIDSTNTNILDRVSLQDNKLKLYCKSSPYGCKARYAVNGIKEKSGYRYGPRGNLRDSQGKEQTATILKQVYPLHNWCYQFDILVE